MRIPIPKLPLEQSQVEGAFQSELLLRIINTTGDAEFTSIVSQLGRQQHRQLQEDIEKVPDEIRGWTMAQLSNRIDAALEKPVQESRDLLKFLGQLKTMMETWMGHYFKSEDRLAAIATTNADLKVVFAAFEMLSIRRRGAKTMHPQIVAAAVSMAELGPTREQPERFTGLSEEDRLHKQLFGRFKLHHLDSASYQLKEDDLQPYFSLLKTKTYPWLVGLSYGLSSEYLTSVYREILNSRIVPHPVFHLETTGNYLLSELVTVDTLTGAADQEYMYFMKILHSKESVLDLPETLYFKFQLCHYKKYNNELLSTSFEGRRRPSRMRERRNTEDGELQLLNLTEFISTTLNSFQKTWTTIGNGLQEIIAIDSQQKLELIEVALKNVAGVIKDYQLKACTKAVIERDILVRVLLLIDQHLIQIPTNTQIWTLLSRVVSVYGQCITFPSNFEVLATTQFPELMLRILNTYRPPSINTTDNLYILQQLLKFRCKYCEPLLERANRGLVVQQFDLIRFLLDAIYSNTSAKEPVNLAVLWDQSIEIKALLNQYIVDRLKGLQQKEKDGDIIQLLSSRKKRAGLLRELGSFLRLIKEVKLEPATMKLLTSCTLNYIVVFEGAIPTSMFYRVVELMDSQTRQQVYLENLELLEYQLQKMPFRGMSLQCMFETVGNKHVSNEVWLSIMELFRAFEIVLTINANGEINHTEQTCRRLIAILGLLFQCKADFHQLLFDRLKNQDGVKTVERQRLLTSIHGFTNLCHHLGHGSRRYKESIASALFDISTETSSCRPTMDVQLYFVQSLPLLFPLLRDEASPHYQCLYFQWFCQLLEPTFRRERIHVSMSLHLLLNIYLQHRNELFEMAMKLHSLNKGQKGQNKKQTIRLDSIENYQSYAKHPKKFDKDIQNKLAAIPERLLKLFILRPTNPHLPVNYQSQLLYGEESQQLCLGMYLDQLQQLTNRLSPNNFRLFSKFLMVFMGNRFYDKLLNGRNSNQSDRHDEMYKKAMEELLRLGVRQEFARMAIASVEAPVGELAHDWLASHTHVQQQLEQAIARKASRTQPPKFTFLQMIQPARMPDLLRPAVRTLIKKDLLPQLYSEHSRRIKELLLQAISAEFVKGDTRINQYAELAGIVIEEFRTDLHKVEVPEETKEEITQAPNIRLKIQLDLLHSILERCHTRKAIRVKFIATNFLSELVCLLQRTLRTTGQKSNKIIQLGLEIIAKLLPNKPKENIMRDQQFETVLTLMVMVVNKLSGFKQDQQKAVQKLIAQSVSKAMQHSTPHLESLCTEIALKLLDGDWYIATHIIQSIIRQDQHFTQACIESEIKAFFFSKSDPLKDSTSVTKRSFVEAMKHHNSSKLFYEVCSRILRKQYERVDGFRLCNVVFDKQKHSYSRSSITGQTFISVEPTDSVKRILISLAQKVLTPNGISNQHLETLQQLMAKFPMLVPYIMNIPMSQTTENGSQTFLSKVLAMCGDHELKMGPLLLRLCMDCPLLVEIEQNKELLVSTLIQTALLTSFQSMLNTECIGRRECWLLLMLANLLQLKQVNSLAQAQNSIKDLLERLVQNNREKEQELLFISEPLMLILNQSILEALAGQYRYYEDNRYGSIEQQTIPLQVILQLPRFSGDSRRSPWADAFEDSNNLEDEEYFDRIRGLRQEKGNGPAKYIPQYLPSSNAKLGGRYTHDVSVSQTSKLLNSIRYDYQLPEQVPMDTNIQPTNFYSFIDDDSKYKPELLKPVDFDTTRSKPLRGRISKLASLVKQLYPVEKKKGQDPKTEKKQPQGRERHEGRSIQMDCFRPFAFPRELAFPQIGEPGSVRESEQNNEEGPEDSESSDQSWLDDDEGDEVERMIGFPGKAKRAEKVDEFDYNEIEKVLSQQGPTSTQQIVEEKGKQPFETIPQLSFSKSSQIQKQCTPEHPTEPEEAQEEKPMTHPSLSQQRSVLDRHGLPQSFLLSHGIQQDLFDLLPKEQQIEQVELLLQAKQPETKRQFSRSGKVSETVELLSKVDNTELRRQILMEVPSEELKKYPEGIRIEAQLLKWQQLEKIIALTELDGIAHTKGHSLQAPAHTSKDNLQFLNQFEDPALRIAILAESPSDQIALFPEEIRAEAERLKWKGRTDMAESNQKLQEKVEIERSKPKKPEKPYVYPEIIPEQFKPIDNQTIKTLLCSLYWVVPKDYKLLLLQSMLFNKRVQPKLVTTLLYLYRHPTNNGLLPNRTITNLFKSSQQNHQIVSTGTVVRQNILALFLDLFKSSPYKDSRLWKDQIQLDGIGGIRLQPLALYTQTEEGYCPRLELLDYALYHNLQLAACLLEELTDAPEFILRNLINKLFSSKLDRSFLDSLKSLSDNSTMRSLFTEIVKENHRPQIATYGSLLRYNFSLTSFLPQMHRYALENYKETYNEFLNQIYRIYTLNQLKQLEWLGQFKLVHRRVVKNILAAERKLRDQPINVIMSLPFLMDLETKKDIFHSQIRQSQQQQHSFDNEGGQLEIKLNRKEFFVESFNQIMAKTLEQLKQPLHVKYQGQIGQDAGGLTRDWFHILSKEILTADYGLFQVSSNGNTYQPSSQSYINFNHLKYFKFMGRIVGKALFDGQMISAYFTRSFYKLMLGEELQLKDLQAQEPEVYKSMCIYLELPVFEERHFTWLVKQFDVNVEKQLVPNGKNILLTEENKAEWVRRVAQFIMKDSISQQTASFLEGLHELIPADTLRLFDSRELELLISGTPTINCKLYLISVEDMKNNVQYIEYEACDNVIQWFWEVLATYDQNQLAQIVQFITGTSSIPAGGFKDLKAMRQPRRISIQKSFGDGLPIGHTCFNRLDLPRYPTKVMLEQRMKTITKWGNEAGFAIC